MEKNMRAIGISSKDETVIIQLITKSYPTQHEINEGKGRLNISVHGLLALMVHNE